MRRRQSEIKRRSKKDSRGGVRESTGSHRFAGGMQVDKSAGDAMGAASAGVADSAVPSVEARIVPGAEAAKLRTATPGPEAPSLSPQPPSEQRQQPTSSGANVGATTRINHELMEENRKLREQIAKMMRDTKAAGGASGLPRPQPRQAQPPMQPDSHSDTLSLSKPETSSRPLQLPQHPKSSSSVDSEKSHDSSAAGKPPQSSVSSSSQSKSKSKPRSHPNFLTPSNNALGLIRIATRACVRQHVVELDYSIQSQFAPEEAQKYGCERGLFVRIREALTPCMAFVCHGLGGDIENDVVAAAKASISTEQTDSELSPWQQLERFRPDSQRIGAAIMIAMLHVAVSSLVAQNFEPKEVRIAESLVWQGILNNESKTKSKKQRASATVLAKKLQQELQSFTKDPSLRDNILVPKTQGRVPEELVTWMEEARKKSEKTRGKELQTFEDWGSGRRRRGRLVVKDTGAVDDHAGPVQKTVSHSRFHLTKPKVAIVDVASLGAPNRTHSTHSSSRSSSSGGTSMKRGKKKRVRSSKGEDDSLGLPAHQSKKDSNQIYPDEPKAPPKKKRAPNSSSAWSDSQDFLLFTFHCEVGNSWSSIASRMNSVRSHALAEQLSPDDPAFDFTTHDVRTDNQIKNRYYSTKRRLSRSDPSAGTILQRMLRQYGGDSGGPVRREGQTLIEHLMVRQQWEEIWGRKAKPTGWEAIPHRWLDGSLGNDASIGYGSARVEDDRLGETRQKRKRPSKKKRRVSFALDVAESELKALQREKEVERRIEYIRQNPRLDRYGRPVPDGTPLGSGDASWRRQHGVGAKYSPMTPMLGIGISRDSFLPDSVRFNDKMALRVTPRSSKLTKEVKAWAVKYGVDKDPQFMKKLILVRKKVMPIHKLSPYVSKEALEALHPMIFKFANYSLLDKRTANAHFGYSTRVQMTNAQMWSSMSGTGCGNSTEATYEPNYAFMDKRLPRPAPLTATREQDTRARLWKGGTGISETDAFYMPDRSILYPREPAFTFGASDRPPVQNVTGAQDAPIYMVTTPGPPSRPDLPQYRTFGAKYKSMGVGPRDQTKSRRPKSKEWGAPLQPKKSAKSPVRFGLHIPPRQKNGKILKPRYQDYKLFG
eukprot:g2255.t1